MKSVYSLIFCATLCVVASLYGHIPFQLFHQNNYDLLGLQKQQHSLHFQTQTQIGQKLLETMYSKVDNNTVHISESKERNQRRKLRVPTSPVKPLSSSSSVSTKPIQNRKEGVLPNHLDSKQPNITLIKQTKSEVDQPLPVVQMFVHIPKTGGSSIREAMPSVYAQRFKWGADFNNPGCGVKKASTFHLTLDEMRRCGMKPIPGTTLCVVRDPVERFESEIRWQSQLNRFGVPNTSPQIPALMIKKCKEAQRTNDDDLYAHCQPQVRYLYHDSLSKLLRGLPVCDYLISNPSNHEALLKQILPKPVPHKNKSNKSEQHWKLTKDQINWVKSFYKDDYADEFIKLAVQGKVIRRVGKQYQVARDDGHIIEN